MGCAVWGRPGSAQQCSAPGSLISNITFWGAQGVLGTSRVRMASLGGRGKSGIARADPLRRKASEMVTEKDLAFWAGTQLTFSFSTHSP